MALWNQKCLPAPPTNTYKSNTMNLDLVKLRNVLQDCMRHFKNEDFMTREAALLSRILYRMKMKFRSSKEFKSLEKISHALKIYLSANMGRDVKNVFDLIPSKYQTVTYLPTRNMLSYILVRIQGLVKLMERVYDTCQVAATEINTRLFLGHFWRHYVILFALVSRLYILVKYNTKNLCELYGKLLPHINKLENVGRNWLPEGYILPSDLREWLEVKWVYEEEFIDLTQDLILHPSLQIPDFFNLVDDDDDDEVQFCDEYVLVDEEDINIAEDFRRLKPIKETLTRNRMRGFSINEDDIGEDIAEIIKLNYTNMDNIDLIDMENNMETNSHVTDTNQTFDFEDAGEDISCTVTGDHHLTKDRIITKGNNEVVQSAKECIFKSNSDMKHNKRNNNTTDSVINLVDDSMSINDEVIVIPETPPKNVENNLFDDSVIVLNDTVENTSGLNTKPKTTHMFGINILNLSQELSNSSRKKKRGKSKNEKNSFNENVTNKRNKSSFSNLVTFSQTSMESNKLKSQSPTSQETAQTEETTLQQTNGKRKIGESSYTNENDSAAKKRKPDKEEISADKTSNTKSLINQEKNPKQSNGESNLLHHDTIKQFNEPNDKNKLQQEMEKISPSPWNITSSQDSLNSMTPIIQQIRSVENIELLSNKRTRGRKNKRFNAKKKIKQEDKISPSENNIIIKTEIKTEFETQEKNYSMVTPGIKKNKTKKEGMKQEVNYIMVTPSRKKTGTKKKRMKSNKLDYEGDPISCNFCLNTSSTEELGTKKKKRAKKNKNKINNSASLTEINKDNSEWKKESIVRLTLVKEIPNVTGNRNDCSGPSKTKVKSPENINLMPCLNTPLRATLNIGSLTAISTSGKTSGQNVHNTSLKMTQNKEKKKKKGKEKKFEQSLSNLPENSKKKKVSKKKVKKVTLKKSPLRLSETKKKRESYNAYKQREEIRHSDGGISKFFRDPAKQKYLRCAKKQIPTPKKAEKEKKQDIS